MIIESKHFLAWLRDLSVACNIRPSKIRDAPLLPCGLYQRPAEQHNRTRRS
jgi:hypothetical protein